MRKAVLFAASFMMLAVAASADDATPPTNAATPDPADKIVCHASAPVVGTRLGAKRECATQREWDQRRADAQKALQDTQTNTFIPSGR